MKKIKFYGIGGQGAVTAAKIFSEAVSLYQNEYAITVPAYGHERRGAPVYAHIIVDENPVLLNCYVYEPDVILVMDDTLIDKDVDVGEGCTEKTVLVLNSGSKEMIQRYKDTYGFKRVYACDGTTVAKNILNMNIPNSAMLGALAKTGIVTIEAMERAIQDGFGKVGEKNVNAARDAYERTYEA
ncbi:2-oxoacid:acceptor oxidoreductase family protein [Oscillibacter sp. MSJ-2]|uniref:2-oxoacid:acceptor oxidoreductase family protein n=1 Tax=Dysosmobacter acutus TaxID=2841504 RepID=A0ABS6FCM3_9FIRM|nr:2-oxoacid:acceptor oxidoreductase family protein [Dysosmobacter acutus]MBU5628043.1 2-oxoacid:acceptor oxidoreductase family protein [Dysosmobacter acutus]